MAVVLVGAAPMALAATNPNADPIISQALNGTPNIVDTPAPAFHLTNRTRRSGEPVQSAGPHLALTFLDPVCTSDCPLIAQEFRQADERLGSQSAKVDFVAIVANPIYRSISFTNAFDRQEGLDHMRQLALPDRVAEPAAPRLEFLRRPGRDMRAPGRWSPTATWPS